MTFIPPQKVRTLRAILELGRNTDAEWQRAKAARQDASAQVDELGRDHVDAAAREAARLERLAIEKEEVEWSRYRSATATLTRVMSELID